MNTKFIDLAHNMALKSKDRFRLGAVIARRNKPISTGFNNMNKSHPITVKHGGERDFMRGTHAEIHCCVGVPANDLYRAEMYVVRLLANGRRALAKPCRICQNYLRSVGVQGVWYSLDETNISYMEL